MNPTKIIITQFIVWKTSHLPPLVRRRMQPMDMGQNQNSGSGTEVIQPTQNVGLEKFVEDIIASGYRLIEAGNKSRYNREKKIHYLLRYVFLWRDNNFTPNMDFEKIRNELERELIAFCSDTVWVGQAYRNPFFKSGVAIENECTTSVNLAARRERSETNLPKNYLRVAEGEIRMVPV